MKLTLKLFFWLLFFTSTSPSISQGADVPHMTNLELKVQVDPETMNQLSLQLKPYYSETIFQTDTYFVTKQGRLKVREEKGKNAYAIRYQRSNNEEAKESNYLFYPIKDADLFLAVFGDSLVKEVTVKKQRELYFPKPHIRVHLDRVDELGDFLEIEIILSEETPLNIAEKEMRQLQGWLKLANLKKIDCGYRELLQKSKAMVTIDNRDLSYYKNQNKVFWVIAEDLPVCNFKRYDVIPCIFVEQFDNGTYGIIQLDPSIASDRYQYTAWRKLIGQEHGFRAEVLLIDAARDKLYTLKGQEVPFESLSRSPRIVDRSYLAPFATIR